MKQDYIADNIKSYRKKHGMSQIEFGSRFGVSGQAVSKWENRQAYPDILLLPEIASMMSVSVEELLLKELFF